MEIKDLKWIQGPGLPLGIRSSSCVALPPTSDFACVLIGGLIAGQGFMVSSNVYGLNRSLKEWKFLGKIRKGRVGHIALPFSI